MIVIGSGDFFLFIFFDCFDLFFFIVFIVKLSFFSVLRMFPVCVLAFDLLSEVGINLWTFHVRLAHPYVEAEFIVKVVNQVQHVLVFWRDRVSATDSEGFFVFSQRCFVVV